ncbi:MAG: hypothetical protein WBP41_22270 [Saprospiraceae bacterium]
MKRLIIPISIILILFGCESSLKRKDICCSECYKLHTLFIDTLQSIEQVEELARQITSSGEFTIFTAGLLDSGNDNLHQFRNTFAKIKYNINFVYVGEFGDEKYDKFNILMWNAIDKKYGINGGTFNKEYKEKYQDFISENRPN